MKSQNQPGFFDLLDHHDQLLQSGDRNMREFIAACQRELKPSSFKQAEIVIKKPKDLRAFVTLDPDLIKLGNMSFDISKEDAAKIANQMVEILTDPFCVASLLKELDTELGEAIRDNKLPFTDHDYPEFLILGKGNYIPGPPPKDYRPKKKADLLNAILLKYEQDKEINKEGDVPRFVGPVDSERADSFVASSHLFTEETQISTLLLHGAQSHRLAFHALRCAAKNDKLNLQLTDGKKLNFQQLLELLVRAECYSSRGNYDWKREGYSLWALTVDFIGDAIYHSSKTVKDFFNIDDYNFSCRSPQVLNSVFLCFGKELGLPNLQHLLLDSHWRGAYEMVHRVKNEMGSKDIPDSIIYTYCMEAFSTAMANPGDIGVSLPFNRHISDVVSNPRYKTFEVNGDKNIVKKLPSTSHVKDQREYNSWADFFDRQKEKQQSFSKLDSENQSVESSSKPDSENQSLESSEESVVKKFLKSIANKPGYLKDLYEELKKETQSYTSQLRLLVASYSYVTKSIFSAETKKALGSACIKVFLDISKDNSLNFNQKSSFYALAEPIILDLEIYNCAKGNKFYQTVSYGYAFFKNDHSLRLQILETKYNQACLDKVATRETKKEIQEAYHQVLMELYKDKSISKQDKKDIFESAKSKTIVKDDNNDENDKRKGTFFKTKKAIADDVSEILSKLNKDKSLSEKFSGLFEVVKRTSKGRDAKKEMALPYLSEDDALDNSADQDQSTSVQQGK